MTTFTKRSILRWLLLGIIATCLSVVWMTCWTRIHKVTRVIESSEIEIANQPATNSFVSAFATTHRGFKDTHHSKIDDMLYPTPKRLGSIHDFTFMINRDVCGEDPVDLLILVGSHPNHHIIREMLRDTWGSTRIDDYIIKMVFFFGRPDDAKWQQELLDESSTYGDIVQGNFRDDYHNITYRDLMAFRWTWRHCSQARFVMRTDDDMVIDIDGILQALETRMPQDKEYVACMIVFRLMQVLREGQYGVSREEHPSDVYEPYCQGWTYWMTPRACKALDEMALKVAPYWMNDAYITGTLMSALGWSHRLLGVPYTNNMVEMVEYLNCPLEEKPLFALGPSLSVNKTKALHRRFSLRAQKNGIPNRNGKEPPENPYYQNKYQDCDYELRRLNNEQTMTGSPLTEMSPVPFDEQLRKSGKSKQPELAPDRNPVFKKENPNLDYVGSYHSFKQPGLESQLAEVPITI